MPPSPVLDQQRLGDVARVEKIFLNPYPDAARVDEALCTEVTRLTGASKTLLLIL